MKLFYAPALWAHYGRIRLFRVAPRSRSVPPTLWVDVTRTARQARNTGVERVTREVSRALLRLAETEEIGVKFFSVGHFGNLSRVPNHWLDAPNPVNLPKKRERALISRKDSVLLLDLSLPPRGLNASDVRFFRRQRVQIIQVVYDLLPLTLPHLFPAQKKLIFSFWLKQVIDAQSLLFISDKVRSEFVQLFGNARAEVTTILPLSSTTFPKRQPAALEARGHGSLRLVALGTLEPRKDYESLVDAFRIAREKGVSLELVIVGSPGWSKYTVREILRLSEKQASWFTVKQGLSDAEVHALIESSLGLIANSIDEGFGLPLVEAGAQGARVLARDIPIFREVAPWASFFSGNSAQEVADSIIEAVRQGGGFMPEQLREGSGWTSAASAVFEVVKGFASKDENS